MSRKKAEKSNTPHIGIFTDKSAKYNLGILETLDKLKHATAWQIAKTLSCAPEMSKEALDYRARSLYSIIQRKGGRLEDLESKGYIQQEEGLYNLTRKGNIALVIKRPELLENLLQPQSRSVIFEQLKQSYNTVKSPDTPTDIQKNLPFGITVNVNLAKEKRDHDKLMDQMNRNPTPVRQTLEDIKALLCEGIDLDRISEDTLEALLASKSRFKGPLKDLLKTLE